MIDTAELQGGMLRGYGHPVGTWIFATVVTDPAAARARLAALAGELTPACDWQSRSRRSRATSRSPTARCARCELPEELLDGFPESSAAGWPPGPGCSATTRRASRRPSTRSRWSSPCRPPTATRWRTPPLAARSALAAGGLDVAGEQPAGLLDGSREHFGFTDGFSQPAIAGFARDAVPGQGVPYRRWPFGRLRWRPLAAGEFVLGVPDEDGDPPPAPPAPFDRETTFMVLRKLRQDVAAFRAQAAHEAARLGMDEDTFKARLVGRWPDGSPLALRPDGPDPVLGNDPEAANDFAYADDPDGLRCPRGAHVRRANPRDGARVGGPPDGAPPDPAPRDALRHGARRGPAGRRGPRPGLRLRAGVDRAAVRDRAAAVVQRRQRVRAGPRARSDRRARARRRRARWWRRRRRASPSRCTATSRAAAASTSWCRRCARCGRCPAL